MSGVAADTHALVWYFAEDARLSEAARSALDGATAEGEPIYLASITLVELRYLIERRRLAEEAFERLARVVEAENGAVRLVALDLGICRALGEVPRDVVPDMPDRIIAATAL